ncbi:ap2 domain transcription factor ap2viib-3 [Cystoisospora suis]|uniref:Ap2 domain transcription factor ap2viib-3 n=1 Tax=Cystoisospora suis TaxID=483139 RepID=A0A2C6KR99_9APIC|nr:ap2 domain transcription factor ap2viib-3 [Cystoisospora suis]
MVHTSAAKAEVSVTASGEEGGGEGEDALACHAGFPEGVMKEKSSLSFDLSSSGGPTDELNRSGSMSYPSSTGDRDTASGCCLLPSLAVGRSEEDQQTSLSNSFVQHHCKQKNASSFLSTLSNADKDSESPENPVQGGGEPPSGSESVGRPCWEFPSFCDSTGEGVGGGESSPPSISFFPSVGLVGVNNSRQIPRSPTNSACGGGSPAAAAVVAAAVCTPSTCASQSSPLSVVSSLRSTEPADFSPQSSLVVPSLSPLGSGDIPVTTLGEGSASSAVALVSVPDTMPDGHTRSREPDYTLPYMESKEKRGGGEAEEDGGVWRGGPQESSLSGKSYSAGEGEEEQELSKRRDGEELKPVAGRRERKRQREEEDQPEAGSLKGPSEPPCDDESSSPRKISQRGNGSSYSRCTNSSPEAVIPSPSSQTSCPLLFPTEASPSSTSLAFAASSSSSSLLTSHDGSSANGSEEGVSSPSLVSTSSSASAVSGGGGEALLTTNVPTASFDLKTKHADEEDSEDQIGFVPSSISKPTEDPSLSATCTEIVPVSEDSSTSHHKQSSLSHAPSSSCLHADLETLSSEAFSPPPPPTSISALPEDQPSVHHDVRPQSVSISSSFPLISFPKKNDTSCSSPSLCSSPSSRKELKKESIGTPPLDIPACALSSSSVLLPKLPPEVSSSHSPSVVSPLAEAKEETLAGREIDPCLLDMKEEKCGEDSSSSRLACEREDPLSIPSLSTFSPSTRIHPQRPNSSSSSSGSADISSSRPLRSSRTPSTITLDFASAASASSGVCSSLPPATEDGQVAPVALSSSSAFSALEQPVPEVNDDHRSSSPHTETIPVNSKEMEAGEEEGVSDGEHPLVSDISSLSSPSSTLVSLAPSTPPAPQPSSVPGAVTPPRPGSGSLFQQEMKDRGTAGPPACETTMRSSALALADNHSRNLQGVLSQSSPDPPEKTASTPTTRRRASLSNAAVVVAASPASDITASSSLMTRTTTPSRMAHTTSGHRHSTHKANTVVRALNPRLHTNLSTGTPVMLAEGSEGVGLSVSSPSSKKDTKRGDGGSATDDYPGGGVIGMDSLWLLNKTATPSRASVIGEGDERGDGRDRGSERREGSEMIGEDEEAGQNEDDEVTRLHRLDLLRHSHDRTTVELYKMEKGRLVEELVRKAKKYPKVPGVYFDRYQQRWCVNWTEAGRRVARYFPVKAHGFDFAYQLAVSCMLAKKPGSSPSAASASSPSSARGSTKSRPGFVSSSSSSSFGSVSRGLKAEPGGSSENPRGGGGTPLSSSARKTTGTRRSTSVSSSTTSRGSASQLVTSCGGLSGFSSDTSTPSSSLTETGKFSSTTALHHPSTHTTTSLALSSPLSGAPPALTAAGVGGGTPGIFALQQQMLLAAQQAAAGVTAAGRTDGGQLNCVGGGGPCSAGSSSSTSAFPLSALTAAMATPEQALSCAGIGGISQGTAVGGGIDTQNTGGLLAAFLRYQRAARLQQQQQQQQLTAMLSGVAGVGGGDGSGASLRGGQSNDFTSGQSSTASRVQARGYHQNLPGGGGLHALAQREGITTSGGGCSPPEAGRGSLVTSPTPSTTDTSAALMALLSGAQGNTSSGQGILDPSSTAGAGGLLENAAAALLGPLGTDLLVHTHPSLLLPSVTALARKLNQHDQQQLAAALRRGGGDDIVGGAKWSSTQDEVASRHLQNLLEDEGVSAPRRVGALDAGGGELSREEDKGRGRGLQGEWTAQGETGPSASGPPPQNSSSPLPAHSDGPLVAGPPPTSSPASLVSDRTVNLTGLSSSAFAASSSSPAPRLGLQDTTISLAGHLRSSSEKLGNEPPPLRPRQGGGGAPTPPVTGSSGIDVLRSLVLENSGQHALSFSGGVNQLEMEPSALQKQEMAGGGASEQPSNVLEEKRKTDILRPCRRSQGDITSNSITRGSEGNLPAGDLSQVVKSPRRPMITSSRGNNTLANDSIHTVSQKHTTTPSSCTEGMEERECDNSGRYVAGEGGNSEGVHAGHTEDSAEGDLCAREELGDKLRSAVADDSGVKHEGETEECTNAAPSSLLSGRCQVQRRKEDVELLRRDREMAGGKVPRHSFEKNDTREIRSSSSSDLSISPEAPSSCSGNTTGLGLYGEADQSVKLERCNNSSESNSHGSCSPTNKATKEGRDRHHSKTLSDDKTSSVNSPLREGEKQKMMKSVCRGLGAGGHQGELHALKERTDAVIAQMARRPGQYKQPTSGSSSLQGPPVLAPGEDGEGRTMQVVENEKDDDGGEEAIYDPEADKAFANQPVKELVREAMKLKRVPGVWFDRSQLRWACNYRDTSGAFSPSSSASGDSSSLLPSPSPFTKRRAQYFPVKEHGFFRARQLAIQTRRRMNDSCHVSSLDTGAGRSIVPHSSSSPSSTDSTLFSTRATEGDMAFLTKNEKPGISSFSPTKKMGGGRGQRTPAASTEGERSARGEADRLGERGEDGTISTDPGVQQCEMPGGANTTLSALSTLGLSGAGASFPSLSSALQGLNVMNLDKPFLSSAPSARPTSPSATSSLSLASVLGGGGVGNGTGLDLGIGSSAPTGVSPLSTAAALLGRRLSGLGETSGSQTIPASLLEEISMRLAGGAGGGTGVFGSGAGGALSNETAALAELLASPLSASLMLTAAGGSGLYPSSFSDGGLSGMTQALEQRVDQRQQLLSSATTALASSLPTMSLPDLLSNSNAHAGATPGGVSPGCGLISPSLLLALSSPSPLVSSIPAPLTNCGSQLLALQKDAIQYILEDLRQNCLTSLSGLLPPAMFQSVSLHLMKHVQRVERAKVFTEVEPFLGLFLDCINSKQMPSQLPVGVQLNLIQLAVALDTLLDRSELVARSAASANAETNTSLIETTCSQGGGGGGSEAPGKLTGEDACSPSPEKRRMRGDRDEASSPMAIRVARRNASEDLENSGTLTMEQLSQLQQQEEIQRSHCVLRPPTATTPPRRQVDAPKEKALLSGVTAGDSANTTSWLAFANSLPTSLDMKSGTRPLISGAYTKGPTGGATTPALSAIGERGTPESLSLFSSTLGGLLTGGAASSVTAPTSLPPSSV